MAEGAWTDFFLAVSGLAVGVVVVAVAAGTEDSGTRRARMSLCMEHRRQSETSVASSHHLPSVKNSVPLASTAGMKIE